ncbi:hypothetical protein [Bradyrhizobium elkanii]|uniref:hypothetical protein n=1 Tax=Bradyrhizobium elkanii TaxID=29448 RepID=UPI0035127D97
MTRKAPKRTLRDTARPFFFVNDNRISYSWGTGVIPGYSAKGILNTVAFTHFDVWAYGTNFVNVAYVNFDHSVPTAPCVGTAQSVPTGLCAGAGGVFANLRSTFGWNELFDTKAFSVGPLSGISFMVGADVGFSNAVSGTSLSALMAGVQFNLTLPYKGYFSVTPLYYQKWEYDTTYLPTSVTVGVGAAPFPGTPDGITHFDPTWGVDLSYFMELGFLPENLEYFSISGRASFRGPQGLGAPIGALTPGLTRTVSLTSEPIRLTFDVSKYFWGPKYSHLIDVWTAWRYSKNNFGFDDAVAPLVCLTADGRSNGACTGGGVFYGITMKVGDDVPGAPAMSVFGLPFLKNSDDRLTYAVLPDASSPGQTARTQKQAVAYTHQDVWAYGTNVFRAEFLKSDHRDPSTPCSVAVNDVTSAFGAGAPCAGNLEFDASLRSSFGFNEIFGTRAFSAGPLRNVSALVGADVRMTRTFEASNKKAVVAGLQFGFDLPYGGYFNIAPLYYQEWNHSIFAYGNDAGNTPAGLGILGQPPYVGTMPAGFTGTIDGNLHFNPTWALEIGYGMELGFLPESLRYFSVSGQAGFYGPKGNGAYGAYTLPSSMNTATEIKSEPIRLTIDVSKVLWGQRYSHFIDAFVAYRYWKNKFGLDAGNPANRLCSFANGTSNRSCTEETVYAGVSMKF